MSERTKFVILLIVFLLSLGLLALLNSSYGNVLSI